MPLWNPKPHKPSDYELIRLKNAVKGKSGGSVSEWAWHGGKRRHAESPTLFGTNTGVFAKVIDRNSDAIQSIRTWGTGKEGVTRCDFAFFPSQVRNPETIVKVDKESMAKTEKLGKSLTSLEKLCSGQEGDHEAEWAITRINGDDFAVFFSSVPSVISRLIRRNRGCISRFKLFQYERKEFGVSFYVDISAVRHPATLVKVG
jgi:hypothetical protein